MPHILTLVLLALAVFGGRLVAAELTNADVIKMAKAGLNEEIILTAISNSEPKFDTSPAGLIALSEAKVSKEVITALIRRNNPGAAPAADHVAPASSAEPTPAPAAAAAPAPSLQSPSEVILVQGDEAKPMRYLVPQVSTRARALGWGGVASYAVLRGSAATERLKTAQPSFLVAVPNQAQVESYLTIASFAVRGNNSREVLIGGGFMGYSSGIHPDRIIAVTTTKLEDQSRAQSGFTLYRVTPAKPLAPGEYAVILYTGEMQSLVSMWFSSAGNAYFDFGL